MKKLQIRLLGSFQATWDGVPLEGFRSDKVRALLAYLATEGGHPHRRESLTAMLWEADSPKAAWASLRTALSNLRQVLSPLEDQPPLLITTRQSVTFDTTHPDCWVDVVEFDQLMAVHQAHVHQDLAHCSDCLRVLARMVALCRGDFLSGLTLPDSLAFDEWRVIEQQARHYQVLEALSALITHHRVLGHYDEVERYARLQIELEP